MPRSKQPPGSERGRDEKRPDRTPRDGGREWQVADRRAGRRYGHARNEAADAIAPAPIRADPDLVATEPGEAGVAGGERAGMGRSDKPRKAKRRTR